MTMNGEEHLTRLRVSNGLLGRSLLKPFSLDLLQYAAKWYLHLVRLYEYEVS
jgi:hypothetical protein